MSLSLVVNLKDLERLNKRLASIVGGDREALLDSVGNLLANSARERISDSISHEVDGDVVRIGSNLIYAGVHDQGWEKKNIPARTYLGISADDEEAIEQEVSDWFEGLLT